jgi:threonylcarbamoyladenosine tRNA methylthiotransferase MtaB
MKIRLDFIGCRLNISEMESLGRQFRAAGHQLVGPGEPADLCVFNSCAVTGGASQTSRQRIRRLRRDNPQAKVIVTGCYAELEPQKIAKLGVDLVVSNDDKDRLLDRAVSAGLLSDEDLLPAPDAPFPLPSGENTHTRAFIKVQDGCDNRCTFCIVTVARGAGRSRGIAEVVQEIQSLSELGYQEAVLTGVHLGSFGHDDGNRQGLFELVQAILSETDISRLRLSSLEPWDLDADFFSLWADPRLCRHLHLPLQSGSDDILRRMARRTSQAEFSALVESARAAIPGLSVTTDLIVGFPGETETHFQDSLAFVDQMAFSGMHIFRFSSRAGTAAAKMKGQIHGHIIKERSQQMHELSARHERAFRTAMLGQTAEVLWETSEETLGGQLWSGLTDNYVRVSAFSPRNLSNTITPARLTSLLPDALSGEIPGEVIPLQVAL